MILDVVIRIMNKTILTVFVVTAIATMMVASQVSPAFAANIESAHIHSKGVFAVDYGYRNSVIYVWASEDKIINKDQEPNMVRSSVDVFRVSSQGNCYDSVEPKTNEFLWSMGNARINVNTSCGIIDLTFKGQGDVLDSEDDAPYCDIELIV